MAVSAIKDQAEDFGLALIENIERFARHARFGEMAPDDKEDAVDLSGDSRGVIGGEHGRSIDNDLVIAAPDIG